MITQELDLSAILSIKSGILSELSKLSDYLERIGTSSPEREMLEIQIDICNMKLKDLDSRARIEKSRLHEQATVSHITKNIFTPIQSLGVEETKFYGVENEICMLEQARDHSYRKIIKAQCRVDCTRNLLIRSTLSNNLSEESIKDTERLSAYILKNQLYLSSQIDKISGFRDRLYFLYSNLPDRRLFRLIRSSFEIQDGSMKAFQTKHASGYLRSKRSRPISVAV